MTLDEDEIPELSLVRDLREGGTLQAIQRTRLLGEGTRTLTVLRLSLQARAQLGKRLCIVELAFF